MNLSFMTQYPKQMGELAGQPTYFVDKIWAGLNLYCKDAVDKTFVNYYERNPSAFSSMIDIKPKVHSIRADPKDRWKIGSKIHFIINPRTPNRFQFAPVIPVVSECRVFIQPNRKRILRAIPRYDNDVLVALVVGEEMDTEQIALNDGFDSVDDFFRWFRNDDIGSWSIPKIIHWTDLRY